MKCLMTLIPLVGLLIFTACAGDDETQLEPTPTVTPTPAVSATDETQLEPTPTVTPTPAVSATPEPTAAPTEEPTATKPPEPTPVQEATATPRPTPRPTSTPRPTATPEPTATIEPTATPEPEPTATPPPMPTATPAPVYGFVTGSASTKLSASDSAQGKKLGNSVAIYGDTVIVGTHADFAKGTDSGAAVVFARTDGVWTEQAKLIGEDTSNGDLLGQAVAISGDTVVLGAIGDTPVGTDSGAAYAFARSEGVWTQQAKLIADDAGPGDKFGSSVAVSGDSIVIGTPSETPTGTDSGTAYVFTRADGTWTQQAKLTGSGQAFNHMFGWSVAIDGDTAVVGALNDTTKATNSGAAYVFTRADGTWTEQAKLTASDGALDHKFGRSVAISGDTVVVGAAGVKDKGADTGAVYVFFRSDGTWTEQGRLTASDAAAADNFGWSVSVSGDTVVAGALNDTAKGPDSGSVYVYKRTGSVWAQEANLTATGAAINHKTGTSVSVSGNYLVAGSPGDFQKGTDTGAAHVFAAEVQ